MPAFLKNYSPKRKQVVKLANEALARPICANEAAVLADGRSVFVDSETRDPVTGLYPLYFL